jgi:hypothetical protein
LSIIIKSNAISLSAYLLGAKDEAEHILPARHHPDSLRIESMFVLQLILGGPSLIRILITLSPSLMKGTQADLVTTCMKSLEICYHIGRRVARSQHNDLRRVGEG